MRASALLAIGWLAMAPAVQAAEPMVDRLAAALRIGDVVALLRDEGLTHGQELDTDILEGIGGQYFGAQVSRIFDTDAMTATLTGVLAAEMSFEALRDSVAFFEAETGKQIVALELSARLAFIDADVEEAALDQFEALDRGDPQRRLVEDFVEANDLIDRNVDGIIATDYSFYLGLADGGAMPRDDEGYLALLMEDRDDLVDEITDWSLSFHLLAYHSLSDEEQQANIDFSRSPSGQELNNALFVGFDRMYADIYYDLGRLIAAAMEATDL